MRSAVLRVRCTGAFIMFLLTCSQLWSSRRYLVHYRIDPGLPCCSLYQPRPHPDDLSCSQLLPATERECSWHKREKRSKYILFLLNSFPAFSKRWSNVENMESRNTGINQNINPGLSPESEIKILFQSQQTAVEQHERSELSEVWLTIVFLILSPQLLRSSSQQYWVSCTEYCDVAAPSTKSCSPIQLGCVPCIISVWR